MLVARSLEKIVASNKPTQRNHHPQPFGRDIATDLYGWINPDTFIPQLQTSMSGFLDENFLQKNPVIPVIQPMAIEKPETRSDLFSPFFALYHTHSIDGTIVYLFIYLPTYHNISTIHVGKYSIHGSDGILKQLIFPLFHFPDL